MRILRILLVGAVLAAGCGGDDDDVATAPDPTSTTAAPTETTVGDPAPASDVTWELTGSGWAPVGTPPPCPDPLVLQPPVDVRRATSILYPGQNRPDYKPHGAFRFDGVANEDVEVVAPIDGTLVRGSRFLVGGELQYTFDLIAPCGIMVRLGHLLELPPELTARYDELPEARENDSRTERFQPPIPIEAGDVVAVAVGLRANQNTFVDFGVFDLRQRNEASADPAYASAHGVELEQHAVCWFDLLPPEDAAVVRSLPPGDPTAGTSSDYCG